MCFYENLGRHFLKSNNVGRNFYPDFQGLLPRFSTKQKIWKCACKPCTPTSNTTDFHNGIIYNFVLYQDRLETNLLQLFRHPEYSEWFSI